MLSKGSGLFCVDPKLRTAHQIELLLKHPWRTRLLAYLHEAGEFGADWVYFRLSVGAGAPRPEMFIFDWQAEGFAGKHCRPSLATLYHHLWNYGRVPLALILRPTAVDIYNLLPPPQFDNNGQPQEPDRIESLTLSPANSIALAGAAAKGIANTHEPFWKRFSAYQFDSGAFWEAKENQNLVTGASSLDLMVSEMREVRRSLEAHTKLNVGEDQKNWFVRRLIIITLMVRFLEDRKILPADYFKDQEYVGADNFTELLRHPRALLRAICRLEHDFNGDVFHIDSTLCEILGTADGNDLEAIANFAAGNMKGLQQFFWQRYSFQFMPVEVISYVYEDFLGGKSQAYFTPHHLVDLLLDEAMPERDVLAALDNCDPRRPHSNAAYPVLDPACGSGVFLVGAWRRLIDAFRVFESAPTPQVLKKLMVDNLFGVDIEKESVELTIFSLCVALCSQFPHRPDDPCYVFNKLKELKFPNLKLANILEKDFFIFRESILNGTQRFRLIIGNPPFESKLNTEIQSDFDSKPTDESGKIWSPVPDDQISYLFLRGVAPLLSDNGLACLVQPAGLIYNEKPAEFRRQLFTNWHVPQVLDFASIAGLFTTRKRASAKETASKVGVKTVAVFVHNSTPVEEKPLLHATFRRTALLNHRQVFEIDPQDLHWIPRKIAAEEPRVWKANLLGGGRLLETYKSFSEGRTFESYIKQMKKDRQWVCSEGFIEADIESYSPAEATESKKRYTPQHKPERAEWDLLDTDSLSNTGIDEAGINQCKIEWYLWPRDDALYSPPHLLIKEHESLPVALREAGEKLLFRHEIIGIAAPKKDIPLLKVIYEFLENIRPYMPFFASFGPRYLVGRQTAVLKKDIMVLPYPEDGKLVFRGVQKFLRDDVINFMIPLIKDTDAVRLELAAAAKENEVMAYAKVFTDLLQSAYRDFKFVEALDLDTGWCIAFHKGNNAVVKFGDPSVLRKHLDSLLSRETGRALRTWRILRHFSGNDLYIIKPKPRRYWLKSAAVSDADQVFAWVMKRAVRLKKRELTAGATI